MNTPSTIVLNNINQSDNNNISDINKIVINNIDIDITSDITSDINNTSDIDKKRNLVTGDYLNEYNKIKKPCNCKENIINKTEFNINKNKKLNIIKHFLISKKNELDTVENNLIKKKNELDIIENNLINKKNELDTFENNLINKKNELDNFENSLINKKIKLDNYNKKLISTRYLDNEYLRCQKNEFNTFVRAYEKKIYMILNDYKFYIQNKNSNNKKSFYEYFYEYKDNEIENEIDIFFENLHP